MGWQGWCSGLVLCLYARMLGFESRSMQFFYFFFSLKFAKFMPVLLIGTGAGAVDTAFQIPMVYTMGSANSNLKANSDLLVI